MLRKITDQEGLNNMSVETIDTGVAAENTAVQSEVRETVKPEKPVKKRMLEQDIAKGIAIILVIALHTLTIDKGIYHILGGLFGFIMPFFFFMAGYNHRPYRYTYKEIILKRLKQIGIPFLTYSISITIISGVYYMIAEGYTFQKVINSYLTLILTRNVASKLGVAQYTGPYCCIMVGWFIIMLLMASFIFYAVVDYALSRPGRFVSVFLILIITSMIFAHFDIVLPLHISEAPAVAGIMLFGAYFGQRQLLAPNLKLWVIIVNSIIAYGMFILLALTFHEAGFISGGMLWNKSLKEWAVLLSVVYAVIGTYSFVHFCRLLTKTGIICKALAWCGNYSLKLLFLHGVVQLFLCAILRMEPFRMSYNSKINDFRTFYLLALEIAVTVLVILAIDLIKKALKKAVKRKAADDQ